MHRRASEVATPDTMEDRAQIEVQSVFLRGDEILQEDAAQTLPHLRRFALFLRCAIAAGSATRAMQGMPASRRVDAQQGVSRIIRDLMGGVAGQTRLPEGADLKIACARLELLGLRYRAE